MLTKDGAKLLDFGLAKLQNQPADDETVTKALTAQGTIRGTFQYMAPGSWPRRLSPPLAGKGTP